MTTVNPTVFLSIVLLVFGGVAIWAIFYPSKIKPEVRLETNGLGMTKEDTWRLKQMIATVICLIISMIASWYACQAMASEKAKESNNIWIVVIPLGFLFFACCVPFLSTPDHLNKKPSLPRRSSGNDRSWSGTSLVGNSSDFADSSSKKQEGFIVNDNSWMHEEFNKAREIEKLERENDYYKSQNNPTYDTNINENQHKIDKLR